MIQKIIVSCIFYAHGEKNIFVSESILVLIFQIVWLGGPVQKLLSLKSYFSCLRLDNY